VHIYTAIGLLTALMALLAIGEGNAKSMFIWLGVALIIDSTDGMMARKFRVSHWVPRYDGRKLDDITDYINYVLVPVVAMYKFELVTWEWIPALFVVLLASGYGFCMDVAKTDDGYFTGFPSYWNVLLFYLYLLKLPVAVNGLILVVLAVLVFVPIKYLYPSKTPVLRPLNLLVSGLWFISALVIILNWDRVDRNIVYLSMFGPIYYVVLSFILHFRERAKLQMKS
jgi:phosphatidylcholine synthase